MPKVVLPVPETQDSVLRPIVNEITRKLGKLTGFPEGIRINYPGDLEKASQAGSVIGEDATFARIPHSNQITVEVSEQYEEDAFLSTAVLSAENLHIFRDDALQTHIRPIYTPSELTINYQFRCVDKNTAIRWRDEIKTKTSMNREQFIFSLTYHYAIPPVYIHILEYLHSLREKVAGYGEDWETYFKNNRSRRVKQISDLAGNNKLWCVAETQARVLGWFDFTGVPEEATAEDEGGSWVINFSFKVRYEKPTMCVMFYPYMVHNQLINKKYRPTAEEAPPYNDDETLLYSTQSNLALRKFEAGHEAYAISKRQGYAIPGFDDFVPGAIVKATRRLYTALVQIDTANPLFLMNLNDLKVMEFDSDILALMKSEYKYLTTPYESIFLVTLYANEKMAGTASISIDENLNVYATSELSLRKQYHIRVSLLVDLSYLDEEATTRLRESGAAVIKCLNAIDPTLEDRGLLPDIYGDDYIKAMDLTAVIDDQTAKIIASTRGSTSSVASSGDLNQYYGFNTVQTLFINARNKDAAD